jgi:hypothetical protein
MKDKFAHFVLLAIKVNRQHIQLAMAILALAVLVLGIGAPGDGGIGPHI